MVPETVAGADHNWAERMTMTTTNVEILRQGWLDAASALAPGLETLPELLENGLEAAVLDERLDEQSLLRVVTDVTSSAADSLPAEELYFLTRRLQRAVYEYLLSLDALPEPPPRRDSGNGHAVEDNTLIGAEEVAALGRSTPKAAAPAKPAAEVAPEPAAEAAPEPAAEAVPEPAPEAGPEPSAEAAPEPKAASQPETAVEARTEPDVVAETRPAPEARQTPEPKPAPSETVPASPAEPVVAAAPAVAAETKVEPLAHPEPAHTEAAEPAVSERAVPSPEHPTRPAFTLFRRTGASASRTAQPATELNGHEHAERHGATESATAPLNGSGAAQSDSEVAEGEPFVAPRDGFHLSDLADFAVVERESESATAEMAPLQEFAAEIAAEPAEPAAEPTEPTAEPAATTTSADPVDAGAATAESEAAPRRGWRLRDDETEQGQDTNPTAITDDSRFETDPEVVEARLEINDRLRRRRCDEAAALLQRLANDVGGRALADLALDAGDRCRALGKGNAALSCYLAASRADPVHETPLLRLADICIDDHDIDLAVSYLERVTRLRRLRNDDKGALKLYRKIVTIAPYRDDILAMLMRAQANGRFDE